MKLAVLFLFHANPEVCANRLEILRRFNPDISIYGLYGGEPELEEQHRTALRGYLDDYYAFPYGRSPQWKWSNGDQMIAHWYRARGESLPWDTIVVIEWDMIVAGTIEATYGALEPDEVLFPGLRPVREVERWWYHVGERKPECRPRYLAFLDYVREKYDYDGDPCCGFLFGSCLPRQFLERYSRLEGSEFGFIEYKVPIYAQILGMRFCTTHPMRIWWWKPILPWHPHRSWNPVLPRIFLRSAAERALNANKREIPLHEIRRQLRVPGGARIFHPVFGFVSPADLT